MSKFRKILILIVVYILLICVSGLFRIDIIIEILDVSNNQIIDIPNSGMFKTITTISTIVTSIIAGLILSFILSVTWFSNGLIKNILTKQEYYTGVLGVVSVFIFGESIKFINAFLNLEDEILAFDIEMPVLEQLKLSDFNIISSYIDYLVYISAGLIFLIVVYATKKEEFVSISLVAFIITFFLFFTKIVLG